MLAFGAAVQVGEADRQIIIVSGRLNAATVPLLLAAVGSVDRASGPTLHLDLRRVTAVDATGAEALAELQRAVIVNGGDLELLARSGGFSRTPEVDLPALSA